MAASLQVEIGGNIRSLEQALTDANNRLKDFGKQAEKIGKDLSLKITAPLALIAGASVKSFSTVEKGLREVNTLFGLTGDAAEENFGKLSEQARIASKELGILQSDVVPGLYNAISAGVPPDNALDFIRVAGRAAIGGVTDLNTAVDGLSSIVNAFNLDFADTASVADSVFAAVQGGKTTFEEVSASIFQVAPAAAAAKVAFTEVNAAIATLTASGTPTSVATTQIRAALTGLQRPSQEVDAIFQKLGFQNAQLAIESEGLGFALRAVKDATQGNNGELIKLLGSVEAVAAANVLAGTGAEKFNQELERQANAAGAAQLAFEEVDKSFGRQIERTGVILSNIAISIGEILAPAVLALNNLIAGLATRFEGLSSTGKTIAVVIGAVAAAIGPVLLIVGKLISFLPTIVTAIKAVRIAMLALTGPVGLIVAGIALLATVIIKNWGAIKDFIERSGLGDAFRRLGEVVKELFNVAKAAFTGLFNSGQSAFGGLVNFLKPVIKFFVEQFARQLKAAITTITNVIGIFIDLVKGDFSGVFDRLKIIILTIASTILESFKPIAEFFGKGGAIQKAVDSFQGKIAEIQARIDAKNPPKTIAKDAKEAVKEVKELTTVLDTLPSGVAGARIAAPEFVQGGRRESPLSELRQEIKDFKEKQEFKGIFEGLRIETVRVLTPVTDMFRMFAEDVNNIVTNFIGGSISNLASAIGEAIGSGANVFQAFGDALLRSISAFLGQLGDQLIAFGIAGGAFGKLQLALANPITAIGAAPLAIAAGVALKSISGAIGGLGRRGLGGSGGGSVGSGVGSQDIGGVGFSQFQNIQLTGTVKINGQDLVVAFERANEQRLRG
jgi:TP901 family phage tail tape measure protein